MKKLALTGALTLASLFPASAMAASYQALCGGSECTINVTSRDISSPQGTIPVSRVSYWSVNGQSETSVGTGVATTILFGGIGLLGFLAKNHNFDVSVDGYDAEGGKVSMQFKFKNNKPVKSLTEELYRVSGLAMGRQRSVAEIKAIESGEAPLNALSNVSEPGLSSAMKEKKASCAKPLEAYKCNYDAYLAANPGVKAWAEKNPQLADKERIRLGGLTQEEINNKEAEAKKSELGSTTSLGKLE